MSDEQEPVYCTHCGLELGDGCDCPDPWGGLGCAECGHAHADLCGCDDDEASAGREER